MLSPGTVHICVDMQKMFAGNSPWSFPWMPRVLPKIVRLAAAQPSSTIFTRFMPANRPGEGCGTWRDYFEHWPQMTLDNLPAGQTELVEELKTLCPPGKIFEKSCYSPWLNPEFECELKERQAHTLVITGGETDMCVLSAVLGAVDRGLGVILVEDAICSSSDRSHDDMRRLFSERYSQQVILCPMLSVEERWPR